MMRRCLAVLALIALGLTVENVGAASLDAATCGLLKGEQAQLEQGGARANMVKGPDWAKTNLAADKLEQIKRLLHVDEQLLFRCSARTLVELPADADADPAAKGPGDADAAPGQDDDGQSPAKDKARPAAKDKAASPAPKTSAAPAAKKATVSPKSDAGPAKAPAAKKETPAKEAGAPRAAEKAAAPKPKPKPKVDDAFKPPQPDPKVDPFANQPRQ